jgi:hypothetical protein
MLGKGYLCPCGQGGSNMPQEVAGAVTPAREVKGKPGGEQTLPRLETPGKAGAQGQHRAEKQNVQTHPTCPRRRTADMPDSEAPGKPLVTTQLPAKTLWVL